jgi:predicted nuclease of restriction endonuclease-like (RecB) superfamily
MQGQELMSALTPQLSLYRDLLAEIKSRIRAAQNRAALSANSEMILLYWDIGRMIAARQEREGWGAGVIPKLAVDLKNELPKEKGFSERNLKRMLRFFREYPAMAGKVPQPASLLQGDQNQSDGIVPQPAAQLIQPPATASALPPNLLFGIPWFHNVILIEKIKDLPTRYWYACQTLEQGWSRDTLSLQIKNRAHERQGAAITNFSSTLPSIHANIAQGLLKDPYLFDFFTLTEPFLERELETGLVAHIQKFLIELGRGFAFVGRQCPLTVSDREFFIDLLFYHLHLRCYIVVDLKKGDFKPEYAGKMNFYCSAVDAQLRHAGDAPTIGLILCQTKDRILAEYSLKDIHKPIGVADYELTRALPAELASSLPSIETIEAELSDDLEKKDNE